MPLSRMTFKGRDFPTCHREDRLVLGENERYRVFLFPFFYRASLIFLSPNFSCAHKQNEGHQAGGDHFLARAMFSSDQLLPRRRGVNFWA